MEYPFFYNFFASVIVFGLPSALVYSFARLREAAINEEDRDQMLIGRMYLYGFSWFILTLLLGSIYISIVGSLGVEVWVPAEFIGLMFLYAFGFYIIIGVLGSFLYLIELLVGGVAK